MKYKWVKGNNHRYFSRNGKEQFDVTLWALQDVHGNTMHQIYRPIGEVPIYKKL